MKLSIEDNKLDNNIVILKLSGEMDISSAPQFKDKATSLIQEGYQKIVLDLSELGFTDSVGIGSIVASLTRAKEKGGQICAVSPTKTVKKLMDIVGLFNIMDTHDNIDEAVKSLSAN